PDVILASNTSTISITRMAKAWPKPENFAGMHFFNPVDRMQLVEVIRGEKTSDATVATLVALAKRIGKTPIVVRDCPGFLVNRILFHSFLQQQKRLVDVGEKDAIDQEPRTIEHHNGRLADAVRQGDQGGNGGGSGQTHRQDAYCGARLSGVPGQSLPFSLLPPAEEATR